MKLVKLPEDVINTCKEFALARTTDSLSVYKFRGEARRSKILGDILYGALAEYAVHFELPESSAPDLAIYDKSKKNYSKDLLAGDKHIHVKSQGVKSAKNYGSSWIFQKTDPLVASPTDQDFLALCLVEDHLDVRFMGFLPAKKAVFRELKVFKYRGTKTALYLEDVKDLLLTKEELYELSEGVEKKAEGDFKNSPEAR